MRIKHNPFMTEITEKKKEERNLVTEEHISTETTQFSLQCNALGTDINKKYIDTRYINKSKKLFDRLLHVKILVDGNKNREGKSIFAKKL